MIPAPPGEAYSDYQIIGAKHLILRLGAILADEQGLGKTIQAAAAFNCCHAETLSALVVCPATASLNWLRELHYWVVNRRRTYGISQGAKLPGAEIVITSYDALRNAELLAKIRARHWDAVVYDEAHRIKNPEAQRTKAALSITGTHRWALTGTPILNRPIEAYTLLWWVQAGYVPSYMDYAKYYCNAHKEQVWVKRWNPRTKKKEARQITQWNMNGAAHLDELHQLFVQCGMLRRLKADVLQELPPKRRQVISLTPRGEAAKWLQKENHVLQTVGYDEAVARLSEGGEVAIEEWSKARHELALAKVDPAVEHIQDALEGGGKAVVFAHHSDVVTALTGKLERYGAVGFTGSTAPADRDRVIRRFQTEAECRVFVGSIRAAGESITLTAAALVVFVELDPVPGVMSQCEDRCHRRGQKDYVLVQHLVYDGSLDARISKMLVKKQNVITKAVDHKEVSHV